MFILSIERQLEKDEDFQKFLDLHSNGSNKKSWKNDDGSLNRAANQPQDKNVRDKMLAYAFEGESDSSDEETPGW